MKKVGHTSEFFLAFIDVLKKQLLIKKSCWIQPIKNKIILIFPMLHFFKKINTCRYHHQNLDDIIYSSWDIEQSILKLVILGHFLPFYTPLKAQKSKFWNMKKFAGDIIIHMCTKNHNHMIYGSWNMEWDRQIFLFLF